MIEFIHYDICTGEISNCLIKITIRKSRKFYGLYLNSKNRITKVQLGDKILKKSLGSINSYLRI
jgi:hypothetical protein